MELQITETERWHVSWAIKTPLIPLLAGMGGGWLIAALLLLQAPVSFHLPALLMLTVGMGGLALWLALTLPREEIGLVEHPPDGEAALLHTRRFLREERAWQAEGSPWHLYLEEKRFAESGGRLVAMTRLWVEGPSGEPHRLTPYLPGTEARRLYAALAPLLGVEGERR